MRRLLNRFLILLIISLLFVTKVRADNESEIVCEYDISDLKITYDINAKTHEVTYGNLTSNSTKTNIIIAKWGESMDVSADLDIDQDLIKYIADNYACPTGIYVGILTETSAEAPGLVGAALDITGLIKYIFSGNDDLLSQGWSLMTIDAKTFFVTDAETFREDYEEYVGGYLSVLNSSAYDDGKEFCGGLPILGDLCGIVAWAGDTVWDAVTDNVEAFSYTETTLLGIADYDGPYIPVNINCTPLKMKIFRYMAGMKKYRDCSENDLYCKSNTISELNQVEDGIKDQCKSILQNKNYAGGEKECIDDCLNIKETLNGLKEGTDLYEDGTSHGQCGFSERLIAWVRLIIKWIKYIVPVIVIILGILDFIKAIGTDKDDEMKKAQKNFVIRLIAAALIFLVPFIIEFLLTRFGFNYEDCGVLF